MLKKISYKIAILLNQLLEKILKRLEPNKVPISDIARSGNFYFKSFNDHKIFSPSINCLQSQFRPILENEIYGFKTDRDDPYIVDCGANIGLGMIYWKSKFPAAHIICFEPSKKVFEALKKNVKEFQFKNVTCINAALSDSEGTKEFTYNEDLSGSLFLEKDLGSVYSVKTEKLEHYIQKKVDFLKVDIEGEEIHIFPQIVKNLHNIENLFIEYHSFVEHQQSISVFFDALETHGFRYYLEGEYKHNGPLLYEHINLKQDLQVSIWATRIK